MNSNSSTIDVVEMIICNLHKLFNYIVRRSRTINEKKFIMLDIIFEESLFIIFFFIQSDNSSHIEFLKYFNILAWMMSISLVSISFIYRPHKSHKFSGNNPIHIPIFHSFIELIFLDIKRLKIIPFEFQ